MYFIKNIFKSKYTIYVLAGIVAIIFVIITSGGGKTGNTDTTTTTEPTSVTEPSMEEPTSEELTTAPTTTTTVPPTTEPVTDENGNPVETTTQNPNVIPTSEGQTFTTYRIPPEEEEPWDEPDE